MGCCHGGRVDFRVVSHEIVAERPLLEAANAPMTQSIVAVALLCIASTVFAQAPPGDVSGRVRMRDDARAELPGVRVTLSNAGHSQQTVTDIEGRFSFEAVPLGTYRVAASLPGFITAAGDIVVSSETPRAFLNWSLEVGCLAEVQHVVMSPKEAAPLVDVIVHLRVTSDGGSVLVSPHPACPGRMMRGYEVEILERAPARGTASTGPRRLMLEWPYAHVQPAREYLALLSSDGFTSNEWVLPVVSGRVESPEARELHGVPVARALALLAEWARRRP